MRPSIVIAIALLSGCFSMGQKRIADDAVVSQLVQWASTKADVERLLGRPSGVDLLLDGQEKWVYVYSEGRVRGTAFIPIVGIFAGGADTQTHTLTILFRQDGIVDRIGRGVMVGGGGGVQDVRNPQALPQDEAEENSTSKKTDVFHPKRGMME